MENILKLLLQKNITVAAAESCTGGLLSSAFVDIPGSSSVFLEGVVTYSNEAKLRLGVSKESLEKFGAVSEAVALEMAKCVKKRASSRFGLSTTGIAGPGGGSDEKPVGLVYTAIVSDKIQKVYKLQLEGDRTAVRRQTVSFVINKLYEEIL